MGFWDEYEDQGGLSFIKEAEKNVLISNKVELPIYKVIRTKDRFNPPDGEQFIVVTEVDGEERALGFKIGSVESRDRMLDSVQDYLEREDAETPVVVIKKVGQAQILVDPNADDA